MLLTEHNQQQIIAYIPSLPPSLLSYHHVHVHLLPLKQLWQRLILPLDTTKASGTRPEAQVRQELHTELTHQVIHRHDPIVVLPVISPERAALLGGRDPPGARGRRSGGLDGGVGAGRAGAAYLEKRGGWNERCVSELRLVCVRAMLKVAI